MRVLLSLAEHIESFAGLERKPDGGINVYAKEGWALARILLGSAGAAGPRQARRALARQSGEEEERERELREAHRLFTEIGASGHAERLASELAMPAS